MPEVLLVSTSFVQSPFPLCSGLQARLDGGRMGSEGCGCRYSKPQNQLARGLDGLDAENPIKNP